LLAICSLCKATALSTDNYVSLLLLLLLVVFTAAAQTESLR
jgi:hypothetical protein